MLEVDIDFLNLAIIIGVILFSMTLHEAMHAFMGYFLGDDTAKLQGRLTLNPIKHIDPFLTLLLPVLLAIAGGPIFGGAKPVPFNPNRLRYDEFGAAMVAAAGPLTNLLLAFIGFGVYVMLGYPGAELANFMIPTGDLLAQIVSLWIIVNLGFFAFNMLPIPPLDGSRVLYALAPDFVRRGMEIVEQFGIIFIFAIVLLAGPLLGTLMVSILEFFLGLFAVIFAVG